MNIKPFILLSFCISFSFSYDIEKGKSIYKTTCISCHGVNGKTNENIALVVRPRNLNKTILTQQQSFKIIKYGSHYFGSHADIMPTFKYIYDDKDMQNVAYYIYKSFNNKRDEKVSKLLKNSTKLSQEQKDNRLKIGKKIFTKKCSKCHGKYGDGQSKYVEQSKGYKNFIYPYNLTRTLLDENQIFLYAKYGGYFWGTYKDDMPAWGRRYNDVELKSVAYYIKHKINKLSP